MKNMKRISLAALICLAACTVSAAALQREQNILSEKMVRLHVVANSDSQEDQRVKLMVRDAVLKAAEPLLEQAADPKAALEANLELFRQTAVECLQANGFDDSVSVSFGKERFPTREYDSFSLPAGVYTSLRVTIGAGEGHNWWCVVFPSICLRAAGEMEAEAVSAGFTQEEVALITEAGGGYVFKFKLLELLEELQKQIVK